MRLSVRDLNVIETETGKPLTLRIEVSYSKGGRNIITGGCFPRGYYLDMQPLEDQGDGCIRMVLGSGVSTLFESATRLNRKRLTRLRDALQQCPENERYQQTLSQVLLKGGLQLVAAESDPEPVPPTTTTPVAPVPAS